MDVWLLLRVWGSVWLDSVSWGRDLCELQAAVPHPALGTRCSAGTLTIVFAAYRQHGGPVFSSRGSRSPRGSTIWLGPWAKWHSTGLAGGDRSRQAGQWPVPLGGQRTSPTQQALCTTASRHASHLPITPSFIKVMLQSVVCHTVSYFVKTTLHADTYSNESLIWFKVPEAP